MRDLASDGYNASKPLRSENWRIAKAMIECASMFFPGRQQNRITVSKLINSPSWHTADTVEKKMG